MQFEPANDPVPGADENATLPAGAVAPVAAVSVTVTVQVLPLPTVTEVGVQLTPVAVEWVGGAGTVSAPAPELAAWPESAPYEPVIM